MASVKRTVTHLMSGKELLCGIAYVKVLCSTKSGYGMSGIHGNEFKWDGSQVDSPAALVWDVIAVAHEVCGGG